MRRPDWPERLDALLCRWRRMPFRWGEQDCVHFARDVLAAVRVEDWQALDLPVYASAAGAARRLRKLGFSSLPEGVTALLGAPVPLALAQRGDLVALVARETGALRQRLALGVCVGGHVCAPGPCGLVFCTRTRALYCWRV